MRNNPVNFSDPTGHYACGDGEDRECGNESQTIPILAPNPGRGNDGSSSGGDDGGSDLEDNLGLNRDSDLGCTIYSCTVNNPNICPIGQTCWMNENTIYDPRSINPSNPDYLVINFSKSFVSASALIDRYGQWHFSLGVTADLVAIAIYSFSLRRGSIDGISSRAPDIAEVSLFVDGISYNFGGGLIYGASKTWAPGAEKYGIPSTATEHGLYLPASLTIFSASYTVSGEQVIDFVNSLLKK